MIGFYPYLNIEWPVLNRYGSTDVAVVLTLLMMDNVKLRDPQWGDVRRRTLRDDEWAGIRWKRLERVAAVPRPRAAECLDILAEDGMIQYELVRDTGILYWINASLYRELCSPGSGGGASGIDGDLGEIQ